MKKKHFILLLLCFALFFSIMGDLAAQCPMCKIAAESNLENGGSAGKGLNTGILYMLMMPYILISVIGIIWYRNRKVNTLSKSENLVAE